MKYAVARSVMTTWEAGRYCNVSPYTIRHWISEGMLPAYTTPGGHHRIRREDVDAFLASYHMPSAPELSPGKRRVLIAGFGRDDRGVMAALRKISPKLDVKASASAFESGLLVGSFFPHLLLLDMDIEDVDWKAACRQIRSDSRLSSVRIAGVTKRITVERVAAAQESGMAEVIGKPVEQQSLTALIRDVFPYLVPAGLLSKRKAKSRR